MEAISLRHLRDTASFSSGWLDCAQQAPPSSEGPDDDLGCSFESSRFSFIDIYPAELFTLSWTTSQYFDLDLPVVADGTPSPMLLVSASRIFRSGRLLPYQPGGDAAPRPQRSPDTSSPLFYSAQSTPISLSSCSGAKTGTSGRLGWRLRPGCAGGSSSPPLKALLSCLRFLVPLYRKVRAPRARQSSVTTAASPIHGSTSSIQWCHGNADMAIHEAIVYCKKSSGQDVVS